MKRVFAVFLALCMLVMLLPVTSNAAQIVEQGDCSGFGGNVGWVVTDDGTLIISGTGEMGNYGGSGEPAKPWLQHSLDVTKLVINEGVTRIGNKAFGDMKYLASVSLPESLVSIGNNAFERCRELTDIQLPSNLTELGTGAFLECDGLEYIEIPGGVTLIGGECFSMCSSLSEVSLSEGLQIVGPKAFYGASLKKINFPETLQYIGEYAFQGCGITEVTIPEGIIDIDRYAFCGSGLTNVRIPEAITQIAEGTFSGSSRLTSVVLPDTLMSIGNKAFQGCRSLESLSIPKKVSCLGDGIVGNCQALREISFLGNPPTFSENTFQNYQGIIRYPANNIYWDETVRQSYGGSIAWADSAHVHDIQTQVVEATCTTEGYTVDVCAGCGGEFIYDRTLALDHQFSEGTCTEHGVCQREGCDAVQSSLKNHTWDDPAASPRSCTVCGFVDDHIHEYYTNYIPATCFEEGYATHTCVNCGYEYTDSYVEPSGHDIADVTCGEQEYCLNGCGYKGPVKEHIWDDETAIVRTCTLCGLIEGGYRIFLGEYATGVTTTVWVDGVGYPLGYDGTQYYVDVLDTAATNLVMYSYNDTDTTDIHAQYPTGMKVWMLRFRDGSYSGEYVGEFENLLQYSGSSIRITGKKGIRMITSITKDNKAALTGNGLAGYKLVEYGTAICWKKDLQTGEPMTLGQPFVKSNYAYKRGSADPVFAQTGNLVQYTNVLVGFTLDQCSEDIAMRPYIIVEAADGEQTTIYGGIVYRSIGYIAWQNRNVFKPETAAYAYVWEIIHHVYGARFDSDYKGRR